MTDNKSFCTNSDLGALILRITVGGLLMLHGIHKVQVGLEEQMGLLAAKGIPTFFMYLVYISEIVAPVLIILGVFTRLSSAAIVGTMLVVLYVAPFPLMAMGPHGEWAIEIFWVKSAKTMVEIPPAGPDVRSSTLSPASGATNSFA